MTKVDYKNENAQDFSYRPFEVFIIILWREIFLKLGLWAAEWVATESLEVYNNSQMINFYGRIFPNIIFCGEVSWTKETMSSWEDSSVLKKEMWS